MRIGLCSNSPVLSFSPFFCGVLGCDHRLFGILQSWAAKAWTQERQLDSMISVAKRAEWQPESPHQAVGNSIEAFLYIFPSGLLLAVQPAVMPQDPQAAHSHCGEEGGLHWTSHMTVFAPQFTVLDFPSSHKKAGSTLVWVSERCWTLSIQCL